MEVKYTNPKPNNAKNKKKKRKSSKLLILLTVLLLLAIILIVLVKTVFFPIENISVDNIVDTPYTVEDVITASSVNVGDKLFGVSESKLNKIITKKLPYIKEVKLERELPCNLTIVATPDYAKYSVLSNGKYIVISDSYRYLESLVSAKPITTVLKGVSISTKELGAEIVFNDEKQKETFTKINEYATKYEITLNEIDVTNTAKISLVVNNTTTVQLGSVKDLEYKMQYLKGMLKEIPKNETGIVKLENYSSKNPKGYYSKTENQ